MTDQTWKKQKRSRDALAADHEALLERVDRTHRKVQKLRRRMGKKTTRDDRRDPDVDDKVCLELEGFLQFGKKVAFVSKRSAAVIYRGRHYSGEEADLLSGWDEDDGEGGLEVTDPNQDPNTLVDPEAFPVWVPEWRHTGDRLKTFAWIMAMSQEGSRSRTININLGPDVITMAKRARENRNIGFARFFQDRLTRCLRRELTPMGLEPPGFFLWIEAATESRAHVHGGIILPPSTETANEGAVLSAIRVAMKKAGGRWNPAEHENQVHIGQTPDAGWGAYVSKWRLLTRLQLQSNSTVAASSALRSLASAWYKNARASGMPIN